MKKQKSERDSYDKELQGFTIDGEHLRKLLGNEIFSTEEYETSECEDTESDEGESLHKKEYD